ncbi:hypothetical protein A3194_14350 [Candidatus Thiodiazotropha endoloripes]|uniref:FliH/SctL family protein n=1 Tax=Candidatus Thiodiazotropha endoloripes TaxID=1818881 RepID=UPI00083CC438|nr:hypothetical protein [Candidatus Thiodiazotropha endoloripes]ODB84937.1 hypothetical protein A3194_14350 [Candidatus Thiodiazotropha endoloripes]
MSFLVIFNNDYASCCSDNLILSTDDVVRLSTSENLLDYIRSLKLSEELNLKKSVKEGYESGYKEGLVKAEKDLNHQFNSYLSDLTESIMTNRIETDHQIIELACEVINKIAENIKPYEMLGYMANTAIQNLQNKRDLQIYINPVYAEKLDEKIHSLNKKGKDDFLGIDIRPDQTLGELDIIIRTHSGETIASFDDQLNLIKENMLKDLNG